MNKVISHIASKSALLAAYTLFLVFFSLQAKAEISAAGGGVALGGGMSTGVTGAPGASAAAAGMQAPSVPMLDSAQLQKLLAKPGQASSDSAAADAQGNAQRDDAGGEKKEGEKEDGQQQGGIALNLNNEFQNFLAQSAGRVLPMYGYNLFRRPPSTFAPIDNIPVTQNYVIGPGDEIVLTVWGQVDMNLRLTVSSNGTVTLPEVGIVNVAGIKYQDLDKHLEKQLARAFRHFELSTAMGRLRSLQVFVVGHASRPGVYTVSSLSTLLNALFMSGGPSPNGTMRHIQLKRAGKVVTNFDLYDMLLKGDKSRDVQLLSGDVIYIPPIGALAAIAGSVNTEAIFELKGNESLADLLELAGGLTNVAAGQKVTVERIHGREIRKVDEFQLDKDGLARPMQDGDVAMVYAISQRFDNAVKLQGHVAAPMRYIWKEGMRITDLLMDANALIPGEYWARQNSGALNSRYNKKEVNWDYAVVQRLDQKNLTTKMVAFNLGKAIKGDPVENMLLQPGDVITIYSADEALPQTENGIVLKGSIFSPSDRRFVWREGMRISDLIPNVKWLTDYYDYWSNIKGNKLSSGINWGYANIVRLQHRDLTRTMLPFDLGKAVQEGDSANNIALLPGDEITIFTNDEIHVPVASKNKYVRLEGEFRHAGVYQVMPGETLRQLVARVGGVTPQAYLFGSEMTRESTRQMQQKRLDEIIDRLEAEIQRTANRTAAAALSSEDTATAGAQAGAQMALVAKMRQVRATGRIVMELPEQNPQIKDLPDIALEDGDRLYIPASISTVSVMGTVYNQNAFLHKRGQSVSDYLSKAGGPTRDGDEDDVYLVRADGVVLSSRHGGSMFGGFGGREAMPGDTIVVPEKLERYNLTKDLKDWTQIFYQFAIGIASLKTLGAF